MKTCVTTYSFGHYFKDLGVKGVIDKTAEFGFDGIEFIDGHFDAIPDNEIESTAEYLKEKGLAAVNLAIGADFLNGQKGDINAEIKRVEAVIDKAARFGFTMLRHDVANRPTGRQYSIGYDDFVPSMACAIREVTKYAEQKGIVTMTENHGYYSQDANRVEKLINAVAHPNFGALVDLGNFMCADEDPWKSVGIMGPYAKHVHAKDFFRKSGMEYNPGNGWFQTRAGDYIRGTIIGHGDAHIYQSIQTMRRFGYNGYVTVEFEGCEDNLLGIQWGLENLKKFINC